MQFDVNSPILFLLVGAIIVFVVAQSVFFLVKAYRRGVELGLSRDKLNSAIKSSAVFTAAPAIGIFIGVITLSKKLGLPLPWLRLSIIGSLTYELTAAEQAAQGVGTSLSSSLALTADQYVTIAVVMTVGIMLGIIVVPLLGKKISGGVVKIRTKDPQWGELFMTSLFMGMISAFLGLIICDLGFIQSDGNIIFNLAPRSFIPLVVFIVSAVIMSVCGILLKKFKWAWMNDYALPISMVGSMAAAIPITMWLG